MEVEWMRRTMSMAAWVLLIQTSSSMILNYAMQTSLMPVHILKLVEKINQGFLWGDGEGSQKLHSVA